MTDKHARYLVDPDTNHPQLVVADQVEAKQKAGWNDPTGLRANGYVFNRPQDQLTTDAAGASLEARDAYEADKAKDKAQAAPKPETQPGYFGRVVDAIEGK